MLPFKLLNVEPPEVVAWKSPLRSWGPNYPSLTRSTVSFVQVVVQVETSDYDHVTLPGLCIWLCHGASIATQSTWLSSSPTTPSSRR